MTLGYKQTKYSNKFWFNEKHYKHMVISWLETDSGLEVGFPVTMPLYIIQQNH